MDLSNIMTFIPKEFVILVVALIGIGAFIKNLSAIDNKYIPFILLPLGIVFSCLLGHTISAELILQGVICVMVAVGGHSSFKQLLDMREVKEN
ncbi:MAG: phage holin family protein [Cetobacterium sp.]